MGPTFFQMLLVNSSPIARCTYVYVQTLDDAEFRDEKESIARELNELLAKLNGEDDTTLRRLLQAIVRVNPNELNATLHRLRTIQNKFNDHGHRRVLSLLARTVCRITEVRKYL